ncbi:DNA-directed RNA polymerase, partial [Teratosphaeriaceae sp. CCFEE 6253]
MGRTGFRNSGDGNVPWDYTAPLFRHRDDKPALASLRPYNDPIIINSTTQEPAQLIKVHQGLYGTS